MEYSHETTRAACAAVDNLAIFDSVNIRVWAARVAPDYALNGAALKASRDRDGIYFSGKGLGCSRTYTVSARAAIAEFCRENGADFRGAVIS